MIGNPELVFDAHATLGENPCWDASASLLYWVDIEGKSIHAFSPAAGSGREWKFTKKVCCLALRSGGGLVLGLQDEICTFDPASGQMSSLAKLPEQSHDCRFNDGKCDCQGRLWIGSMALAANAKAALYCLGADGRLRQALDNVRVSNGLGWNSDNSTMYYIDSITHQVAAFDFDAKAGEISRKRVVCQSDKHSIPDGMCVDAEGMLWVAYWGGWRVSRHDPQSGKRLADIAIPAEYVTSCAFGGTNLDELYITTAKHDVPDNDARQPHAGGLFRVKLATPGAPAYPFRG